MKLPGILVATHPNFGIYPVTRGEKSYLLILHSWRDETGQLRSLETIIKVDEYLDHLTAWNVARELRDRLQLDSGHGRPRGRYSQEALENWYLNDRPHAHKRPVWGTLFKISTPVHHDGKKKMKSRSPHLHGTQHAVEQLMGVKVRQGDGRMPSRDYVDHLIVLLGVFSKIHVDGVRQLLNVYK